jgi:hypothetical protein
VDVGGESGVGTGIAERKMEVKLKYGEKKRENVRVWAAWKIEVGTGSH